VRVGILKPDHLGDLILAAPAIAALGRRFKQLTLFCHPKNVLLAQHLLPGIAVRALHLPHLDKDRGRDLDTRSRLRALRDEIDLLICLRWDGQIERLLTIPEVEYLVLGTVRLDRHVAAEQQDLVAPLTGPYDILDSFVYPACPPVTARPVRLGAVGLCLSAGFRLNAWPLCHWLDLAARLHRHGTRIVLVGGPAEIGPLRTLAAALQDKLGYQPQTLVGSNDFGATLQRLHESVDLVVATDSGTAHLAALVRPVVSLFGGSPWRRYAPLGRHNAVLSRRYPCSPCQQFDRTAVNTCHTQECLSNLTPDQVYLCLTAYLAGVDLTGGIQLDGVWLTHAPWAEQS
jgi:heptosyltransferase-2